jgi:hypothetical protein
MLLLLTALILGGAWFYTTWRSSEAVLPATLTINGLSMAGMTRDQALLAIERAYTVPVTVTYASQVIAPLLPETIELRVDLEATAVNLDNALAAGSGGLAFARYLLDTLRQREPEKTEVTAVVQYSRERVNAFLQRTAQKYDHPPLSPVALPESGTFRPAMEGTTLNSEASLPLLIAAIISPDPERRQVALVVAIEPAPNVSLDVLEQAIVTSLNDSGGVAGVFTKNLETGQELCLDCDVAYTGTSAIKIASALEVFRTHEAPLDAGTSALIDTVLRSSDSVAADAVLAELGAGDPYSGAQQVTDALWSLGLRNSFISAPFSLAPAASAASTPIVTLANARTDISAQPSPDVQSTAVDASLLVESVYHCARGGGVLRALHPRAIPPLECQDLLASLERGPGRSLLVDGLPASTRVAHIGGVDGATYSEIALVYGPRAHFILVVFIYQPEWQLPEESIPTFSQIGRLTYRFFNGEP